MRKITVLVTGADGFIGSHLVEQLLSKKKYKIIALSLYNSFNDIGWLKQVKKNKNLKIIRGNIEDLNYCIKITNKIDIIFHLASLIAIPYSYHAPSSYINTNIIGTFNVMEAALKNKVKRIIHVSTSEVYGTAIYSPIDENHPLQPQSPYSASKISADALVKSYINSFNLPAIIARPFNTYGPRQSARAVIPSIIIQMLNSKKNLNLGSLLPIRDFNYVSDTCEGMILLSGLGNKYNGEVFNIGSGKSISIGELYKLIQMSYFKNIKKKIISDKIRFRPKNSEVYLLKCDNKKILKLGFKNKIDLKIGLKKTIDWFRASDNLKNYDSSIFNI
jgi:NAD dependent epimerase/dehydratase